MSNVEVSSSSTDPRNPRVLRFCVAKINYKSPVDDEWVQRPCSLMEGHTGKHRTAYGNRTWPNSLDEVKEP